MIAAVLNTMQTNRRKYAPHVANRANLEKSQIMFPWWKEQEGIVNAGYAEQKLRLLMIKVVSSSVVINLWSYNK